jgi:hypothetical protein
MSKESFVRIKKMNKLSRPWQATFLVIFGGLKILINIVLLFFLLVMNEWFGEWLSQFNPNLIVLSAINFTIIIPIIFSIVLSFLIIRGLWIGKKWAPIFLTIIHGVALAFMGILMISDSHWAIPFAIVLFILALDIECWIHPFFNQCLRSTKK